jgi:hypothetical protein
MPRTVSLAWAMPERRASSNDLSEQGVDLRPGPSTWGLPRRSSTRAPSGGGHLRRAAPGRGSEAAAGPDEGRAQGAAGWETGGGACSRSRGRPPATPSLSGSGVPAPVRSGAAPCRKTMPEAAKRGAVRAPTQRLIPEVFPGRQGAPGFLDAEEVRGSNPLVPTMGTPCRRGGSSRVGRPSGGAGGAAGLRRARTFGPHAVPGGRGGFEQVSPHTRPERCRLSCAGRRPSSTQPGRPSSCWARTPGAPEAGPRAGPHLRLRPACRLGRER